MAKIVFEGDLPFGAMSSCMPGLNLDEVVTHMARTGAQEVELSAIDVSGLRAADESDHVAAHLPIEDFKNDQRGTAERVATLFNDSGLGMTIGNYDRQISGNPAEEEKALDYTLQCIDFASALGGKQGGAYGVNVGIFWGWDREKGTPENLNNISEKVYVLARYAEDRGVTLTTENCHMPGGWGPENDADLPAANLRSGASTLANRLYVAKKLADWGISKETIGFIWDPSHPETEGNDSLVEAIHSFTNENNIALHIKGHNPHVAGERVRMAYHGGPALPGAFADADSDYMKTMEELGVPMTDNGWGQQYGRVTLPGVGDFCVTPMNEVIWIARAAGMDGRVIAENETPEKNDAVGADNYDAVVEMYKNCLEVVKPALWKGDSYAGKPHKPLDVAKEGNFEKMMNWKEASAAYQRKA